MKSKLRIMIFHNTHDVIISKSMISIFSTQNMVYFGQNRVFSIDFTSNSKRSFFGIEYPLPNDANMANLVDIRESFLDKKWPIFCNILILF